jgi:hypothetical protein
MIRCVDRQAWIRRGFVGFAILGVVASVLLGVLVPSDDVRPASQLSATDVKLSDELQQLSTSVGQLDGVSSTTPTFTPSHLPDPSATLVIGMKSHASVKSAIAALSLVRTMVGARKLPVDFLSVSLRMHDGAVASEPRVNVANPAMAAAMTAWWSLESATHLKLPLVLNASGDGVAALVGKTGTTPAAEMRTLERAYAKALSGVKDSALIAQWTSPGFVATNGLPPHAVWTQFSTAVTRAIAADTASGDRTASVQLTWSGTFANRSSIVVFVPDAPNYASADAVLRVIAVLPGSVRNVYYESTRSSAVVEYGLHVGACTGARNVLPSDTAYFAHFAQLGISLPPGSGPGSCL